MGEAKKLSLKVLDERLIAVEDAVADLEFPSAADDPRLNDALYAIITSLYHVRQQGAYTLARELEAKYFPDGLELVGDKMTTSEDLKRSGGQ